jgi:hypothetical protein
MTSRHRFEASWTHPEASVRGRVRRNRAWVLALLFALVVVLATVTWSRMMNVSDVSYELRVCEQPLTAGSTWAEVQAAGCQAAPTAGAAVTLWAASDQQEPDVTSATAWTFHDVPVNTSATGVQVDLDAPARSVVLAEPTNERVRRELTGDVSGRRWTANVGARGPVSYWVLVTPAEAGQTG